jgi:hypothetical protein
LRQVLLLEDRCGATISLRARFGSRPNFLMRVQAPIGPPRKNLIDFLQDLLGKKSGIAFFRNHVTNPDKY